MIERHKILGLISIVFFAVVIILSIVKLPKLEFESNILALFPTTETTNRDNDLARQQAQAQMSDFISNRVFFLVSAKTLSDARAYAEGVANIFKGSPVVRAVDLEQDVGKLDTLLNLYRISSSAIMSSADRSLLNAQPDSFVKNRLRSIFLSPASLGSDAFVLDPMGTSDNFVKSLSESQGSKLVFDEGVLYVESSNEFYVFLQVTLADSVFSLTVQDKAMALIERAKFFISEQKNAGILVNGALLFAASGSAQAKSEISTVGLGSLFGIVLLLVWAFRSGVILLLSAIPVVLGVLTGVVACQLVYGQIHIVAMVFGASLIGVSIDYTFHFLMARVSMSTQDSDQFWSGKNGVDRIFNGLTLGLLTSASAYGSFIFSGFPGFQQIALFSCVGLLAAYLSVVGIFPYLLSQPHRGISHQSLFRLCQILLAKYRVLYQRKIILPLVFCLVVFFVVGGSKLQAIDDIRVMQTPSADIIEAHKQFQELTGEKMSYPFYLVSGQSPEQLLVRLEQLHVQLTPMNTGAKSLAQWLPSMQRQQENQEVFQQHLLQPAADGSNRLAVFLRTLHVRDNVADSILENQNGRMGQFLEFDQAYPQVESVTQYPGYFYLNKHYYGLMLLQDVPDKIKLSQIAKDSPGVEWVDQVDETNSLLKEFRVKSSRMLIFAYLGIVTVLFFRYGFLGSIQVVLPPFLATLSTLALFGLLGIAVNVFSIMALLLVLGIGIDYSLFLRESRTTAHETLLSISLSGITTILSFGLLALSQTQAINSFGLTILVGIFCSYIFSPLVLVNQQVNINRDMNLDGKS